jgi:hypothetical protein
VDNIKVSTSVPADANKQRQHNNMIRSRSIPTVLSRATGDGIHSILLIDADGELLGSYGNPPPPPPQTDDGTGTPTSARPPSSAVSTPTTVPSSSNTTSVQWPPLDAASIGALISEVAGDYRRMGEELWLLDPNQHSRQSSMSDKEGGGGQGGGQQPQQQDGDSMGDDGGKGETSQTGKGDKDKGSADSRINMKSLVIELEYVSSLFGVLSFNSIKILRLYKN